MDAETIARRLVTLRYGVAAAVLAVALAQPTIVSMTRWPFALAAAGVALVAAFVPLPRRGTGGA